MKANNALQPTPATRAAAAAPSFGGGGLRDVRSLDEWQFEFAVTAPAPIQRAIIDALLDEAIGWAEARTLGIGGGYCPDMPEVADAASVLVPDAT